MEANHKKILKSISLEMRHLLEGRYDDQGNWHPGDLEQRLAALGVRRDRDPVPVDELPHLSAEDRRAREVVDAYIQLRREAGIGLAEAVAEFVRETAYTWANRLLALRCMEARELIDEVILQKEVYGGRSLEHHRLAQRQPELCTGEDDGLFEVLGKVFNEQARHLPLLFDPKSPGVALRPSPAALKDCIGLLSLNSGTLLKYRSVGARVEGLGGDGKGLGVKDKGLGVKGLGVRDEGLGKPDTTTGLRVKDEGLAIRDKGLGKQASPPNPYPLIPNPSSSPNPYPLIPNPSSSPNPYPLIPNPCSPPNPFLAPDALGWAYQYWNTEEKDRIFEKVRTQKGVKIEGSDIIPVTQLYTEPYMVKFLVQNSLGAIWMGMHSESKLCEQWEYYVKDADRAPVEKKPVQEITFLDPACGSGHFLLEAFDLFYAMYEEELGTTDIGPAKSNSSPNPYPLTPNPFSSPNPSPSEICRSILENNLFGIDIDERAVQIAEAALWMKAAEKAFDFQGGCMNLLASNIRLPRGKDHLKAFLKKHPEDEQLRPALEVIFEGLEHADELGSLLQIEELVEKELQKLKSLAESQRRTGVQQRLWTPTVVQGELPVGIESYEEWKKKAVEKLKTHFDAEAVSADLVEGFFSRSAGRGLSLFDLLARRYDVVAANPPYMGSKNMGDVLKKYVQRHYEYGKRDLYAAFILRCIELAHSGGRVAMVTQQSWMFLSSFVTLRAVDPEKLEDLEEGKFRGLLHDTRIEVLSHLGSGAFEEITGEVVNIVLLALTKEIPDPQHIITVLRLISEGSPEQRDLLLRKALNNGIPHLIWKHRQSRFLQIPQSPICYWIQDRLFDLLSLPTRIACYAEVIRGLDTGNVPRFVRYFWECKEASRWQPYSRGGGYKKWYGLQWYVVEWQYEGARVQAVENSIIPSKDKYGTPGFTYTDLALGNLSVRVLPQGEIFSDAAPAILPTSDLAGIKLAALMSGRVVTFLLRVTTPSPMHFRTGYVSRLPLPKVLPQVMEIVGLICIALKQHLVRADLIERTFDAQITFCSGLLKGIRQSSMVAMPLAVVLHSLEAFIENFSFIAYGLDVKSKASVLEETGTPAGLYPLLTSFDIFPELMDRFITVPVEALNWLHLSERRTLAQVELLELKDRLHEYYSAGPGTDLEYFETMTISNDEENLAMGGKTPIPSETFLEELSQKLEIHPISIYWLLKEGIENEGWRCLPEERRITADRFTVMLLHLLGHRWPKQMEAHEPIPAWADPYGIIPLTNDTGKPTLLDRVRQRISAEFEGGLEPDASSNRNVDVGVDVGMDMGISIGVGACVSVPSIEREFADIMGMPLAQWLETEFFKHHIRQFKKRPIAWQIQSSPFTRRRKPAFACLIYYHKLDADLFPKIRTRYVGDLLRRYETELRGIEAIPAAARSDRQDRRSLELAGLIQELKSFDEKLDKVVAEGFTSAKLEAIIAKEPLEPLDKWCSIDVIKDPPTSPEALLRQEQSYIPDINDGVRVNIAPLQKAGLLASEVLARKDVNKAIEDRAEWRFDERRWCREGKLPQPGWWQADRINETGLVTESETKIEPETKINSENKLGE